MARRGTPQYEQKTARKADRKRSRLERKAAKGRMGAMQKLSAMDAYERQKEGIDPEKTYQETQEQMQPYQEALAASKQEEVRNLAAMDPSGGMMGGDMTDAMARMKNKYEDQQAQTFAGIHDVNQKVAMARQQQDFAQMMQGSTAAPQMALAVAQIVLPTAKSSVGAVAPIPGEGP